jgi:hypothetical protein
MGNDIPFYQGNEASVLHHNKLPAHEKRSPLRRAHNGKTAIK